MNLHPAFFTPYLLYTCSVLGACAAEPGPSGDDGALVAAFPSAAKSDDGVLWRALADGDALTFENGEAWIRAARVDEARFRFDVASASATGAIELAIVDGQATVTAPVAEELWLAFQDLAASLESKSDELTIYDPEACTRSFQVTTGAVVVASAAYAACAVTGWTVVGLAFCGVGLSANVVALGGATGVVQSCGSDADALPPEERATPQ